MQLRMPLVCILTACIACGQPSDPISRGSVVLPSSVAETANSSVVAPSSVPEPPASTETQSRRRVETFWGPGDRGWPAAIVEGQVEVVGRCVVLVTAGETSPVVWQREPVLESPDPLVMTVAGIRVAAGEQVKGSGGLVKRASVTALPIEPQTMSVCEASEHAVLLRLDQT